MQLKPGMRLKSQVCETQVVVVRTPASPVEVWCGGHPMTDTATTPDSSLVVTEALAGGTLLGKRYADDELGLELLCSKPGAGSLSIGDVALQIKGAKALPSSD